MTKLLLKSSPWKIMICISYTVNMVIADGVSTHGYKILAAMVVT